MGFLNTRAVELSNGRIFSIGFLGDSVGKIYTKNYYFTGEDLEEQIGASQTILSNYTLVTKTGNSYFHVITKDNGIETEYSINTGSASDTSIIIKYDPSDSQPAFVYHDYQSPYNYLHYIKLNQGVWSGTQIASIGPSENKNAIDFEYDPNDNLPACIAYDSAGYDLNYYKFNGTSFVKTTILNGGSSANNVEYASLEFDTSDNYPMINFIEGNSSILKSAKYNGTSWTTTNVNTFDAMNIKRYSVTKFAPDINQPIVLMGGATSGVFLNVKDSSNIWKSGKFITNQDAIYQKPEMDISLNDQNDVYISYVDNQNKLVFIEKNLIGLINTNWSSNLNDFVPTKINLLSGASYLDINKNIYLEIDSDLQPVVFYKKDNTIKYIKNTGNIDNISAISFSGEVNFKNVNNSSNYNYDVEFFKDIFNVYQTAGKSFFQYKNLYTSAKTFDQDLFTIYSSDTKINPITNQPNIVLFSNIPPNIRFYYPSNPQRTSWSELGLPSGDIFFSGTNLSAVLTASNNCKFDFDRNTNQAIISFFGFRGNSRGAFLIKKDLEGSGYQYYHVPYTGYEYANSDFKVNPITNKYCLAISNYATQNFETGLIYFEMDSINNSWTKTQVELKTSQANKIYLDFTSGGYPVISYTTQSGTVGLLKLAKYNGTNWTTNIIDSGSNANNYTYNSFQYNSGEDYYGISYKGSLSNSGFYISNKGGAAQKYNLGNQTNGSRIPYLIFKNYKNEVRPFVFMDPDFSQYNYFYYLDNESFITGKFKNTLPSDADGDMFTF